MRSFFDLGRRLGPVGVNTHGVFFLAQRLHRLAKPALSGVQLTLEL
jgi:hypothetical protein